MEIFPDGAFPNLEYHLLQVILVCFSINKVKSLYESFCGSRHIYLGLSIFGHII